MKTTIYKKSSFADFPFLNPLLEIPNIPKELFVRGELPVIKSTTRVLTIVGSRKFTSYGKNVCEKLIRGLRGTDTVIVSGLALGIDCLAHKYALENGLKTVAILGSGLDDSVIYPRSNAKLAAEILASGGALISEYPNEVRAMPYMFPERNRLKAGVSNAVLIIEAELLSGTLITARLSTEYNKDTLAVPGDIFNPGSAGTNSLIRNGATPITSGEDLLEALNIKNISVDEKENYDLNKEEQIIINLLKEPLNKNSLIAKSGLTTEETLMYLSLLEIKGFIKEELGLIRRI